MQQQPIQQQKPHSEKFLRQRKFLLLLPLFVTPFMTFLLWSLGMIVSESVSAQSNKQIGGLNMTLPDAVPSKDSTWNKLNFYEQADKDAAKLASLMKNDPYYNLPVTVGSGYIDTSLLPVSTKLKTGSFGESSFSKSKNKLSYDPYPLELQQYKDPNEIKVYKKLAELDAQLNKNTAADEKINRSTLPSYEQKEIGPSVKTPDIDRLESMMQMMQDSESGGDPEMQQINGMLEKILDIQHPDRVKDKLKVKSSVYNQQVFPVSKATDDAVISLLQSRNQSNEIIVPTAPDTVKRIIQPVNGFYSLEDEQSILPEQQNAIEAIVHETQTLVPGATVKLRLVNDVYINGILIPKDQFVYGMSSLNGERLEIAINSIRYGNNILPVALSVHDVDGMTGIYMPGSITRDVSKKATDQAIQSLGIASLDPSIGAQAASAGITAAKSLLSKKAKLVKVTVKAGYNVLLKDDNQKNQ